MPWRAVCDALLRRVRFTLALLRSDLFAVYEVFPDLFLKYVPLVRLINDLLVGENEGHWGYPYAVLWQ